MYRLENFQKNFLVCIKTAVSPELVGKRKNPRFTPGSGRPSGDTSASSRQEQDIGSGGKTDGWPYMSGRPRRRRGGMSWIFTPAKECNINFSGVFCWLVIVSLPLSHSVHHDPYPAESPDTGIFFAEKNHRNPIKI